MMNIKIFSITCLLLAVAGMGNATADSLYQEKDFQSLVGDRKAFHPGDSLTVQVMENSSASTSADTNTAKNGSIGMSAKTAVIDKSFNVGVNDDFSGKGTIQRSGKMLAQITVTVQSVEANGDLRVKGEQQLEFNDEKQFIKLEGRVRTADISEVNTIPSTRIADARISYLGDGVLAEKQRPGLLTRFLEWLRIL